jgi:excisionase family DNA binding protein
MSDLLDTQEVADLLGVSRERVLQFIRAERLTATKVGQQWIIKRDEFEQFAARPRPVGRPPGVPLEKGEGER